MPNERPPVPVDPLASFRTVFPRQLPGAATRVLDLYRQLRRFERLVPERQRGILGAQIAHFLGHAKRYSPFWADRLSKFTLKRGALDAALSEIQPLTRRELQTEFGRLSAKFPQREALGVETGSSSGSTGTPVKFERSSMLYTPLYNAVTLLNAKWHQIDPTKPLGVIGTRYTDKDRAPLGRPFRWLGPVAIGFSRSTRDRDTAEIFDYCAKRNPSYLQCGPTILTTLAQYAIANKRNDLRPKLALSLGSVVTKEMREIVHQGLGTKIIDRYSSEETGYIALQCPVHDHLHVISPVTHLEIVDENNKPCPVGVPGRVLVTSMQSYAMPLIRYELGDMAEWGEPCDCGITLPVIKTLWGRTRHLITNPDGIKTYARIYAREFESIGGLLEYRFVLHKNEVVVAQLRVEKPSQEIETSVTEKVQKALSYPYPVLIRYVDRIDWGSSWKQEYFGVSDMPPQ